MKYRKKFEPLYSGLRVKGIIWALTFFFVVGLQVLMGQSSGYELARRETRLPKERLSALYSQVNTSRPALALTFDDGPHPQYTPRLLDILAQYGAKATFFVIGENVRKYPEIARRIVAEGHQIGNHSLSHSLFTKLSKAKLDKEVLTTNELIKAATGVSPTCIRPPYGALNKKVKRALLEDYKMDIVLWSVDPLDWKRPGSDVVANRLIDGAKPGAILLAHDIHPQTVDAIPKVILQLQAQGYTFVTLSSLMSMPVDTDPFEGELVQQQEEVGTQSSN